MASSKLYRLSRESLEGAEVSTDGAAAAPPPYAVSAMFTSKAAGVQLCVRDQPEAAARDWREGKGAPQVDFVPPR